MTEEDRYEHMYAMKCLDAALFEMDKRNYEVAHTLFCRFGGFNKFNELADGLEFGNDGVKVVAPTEEELRKAVMT